jgi:dUTP pyrophosphatase
MSKIRGFEKVSLEQWTTSTVEFKQIVEYDKIQLPKRATMRSAGYDIFSPINYLLSPGESLVIPTAFKAYMLEDEKIEIFPRSSYGFKFFARLANTVGIGDSDYYNNRKNEGHYFVKIRNEGEIGMVLMIGEPFAQAIFSKYLLADGDDYVSGEERIGGLGSTTK